MSEPTAPLTVVYHAQCKDGFAAAWAHHTTGEPAFYVAVQHGDPVPWEVLRGRDVLMLDFCWKRPIMDQLLLETKALRVLDHHQTAADAMGGFPNAVFDMKRSGAGMTWDELRREPRPWIIDYVEDRDLWRNSLPHSREINALLSSLPFDFDAWDHALTRWRTPPLDTGEALLQKTQQYVREVSSNALRIRFEGYEVPIVNAPQVDISELLNFLATDVPFSMGWWQTSSGAFKYSLRSKKNGEAPALDVSRIALKYGGGGHASAAGFESGTAMHFELTIK